MPRKVSQQGQALVIIIMVMVLSLATGLAVSNRSTSSVHQTANIANSEQALATAESAAEELLKISFTSCPVSTPDCNSTVVGSVVPTLNYMNNQNHTVTCNTFSSDFSLPCWKDFGNGGTALVTVKTTPDVVASSPFDFYLEKDDTQQVWFKRGAVGGPYTGNLDILWSQTSEYTIGTEPALEISVITSSDGVNYSMSKYAYDFVLGRDNGFTKTVNSSCTAPYSFCLTSPLSVTNAYALRIRTFYSGSSVRVKPQTGSIPFQGHVITAIGQVGDVKRTVQVIKTAPQLPAVFDYGIYSGGTIQ